MGKTVPSYRMALEFEIDRWKGFREALPSEEEREAFERTLFFGGARIPLSSGCNII